MLRRTKTVNDKYFYHSSYKNPPHVAADEDGK
jgi:hypothetical protein